VRNELWEDYCASKVPQVIASMKKSGWVTGIPLGVESPGFMAGLAGIGYGLLRLIEPDRVPSVLALEMPGGTSNHVSTDIQAICDPALQ
jgi:lantibiotic modifying enzyme